MGGGDVVVGARHPNGPLRCEHGSAGHCCACQDCARFTREPGHCQRCGAEDPAIGFNDVCGDCADEMGLTGI